MCGVVWFFPAVLGSLGVGKREDGLLEEPGGGGWQGVDGGRKRVEETEGADKRGWHDAPWCPSSVGKEMKPDEGLMD